VWRQCPRWTRRHHRRMGSPTACQLGTLQGKPAHPGAPPVGHKKIDLALCEKRSAKAVAAGGQSKKALPGSGTQAADTAERHVVNEVVVAHVCAHVHACV
jgi:hypothetical protein